MFLLRSECQGQVSLFGMSAGGFDFTVKQPATPKEGLDLNTDAAQVPVPMTDSSSFEPAYDTRPWDDDPLDAFSQRDQDPPATSNPAVPVATASGFGSATITSDISPPVLGGQPTTQPDLAAFAKALDALQRMAQPYATPADWVKFIAPPATAAPRLQVPLRVPPRENSALEELYEAAEKRSKEKKSREEAAKAIAEAKDPNHARQQVEACIGMIDRIHQDPKQLMTRSMLGDLLKLLTDCKNSALAVAMGHVVGQEVLSDTHDDRSTGATLREVGTPDISRLRGQSKVLSDSKTIGTLAGAVAIAQIPVLTTPADVARGLESVARRQAQLAMSVQASGPLKEVAEAHMPYLPLHGLHARVMKVFETNKSDEEKLHLIKAYHVESLLDLHGFDELLTGTVAERITRIEQRISMRNYALMSETEQKAYDATKKETIQALYDHGTSKTSGQGATTTHVRLWCPNPDLPLALRSAAMGKQH
jgi:hypothetical protein